MFKPYNCHRVMFPATVRQFTLVKYLKYKAKLKWCICTENIKPLYMVILFLEGQKCTFKKGKAAKSVFNFTDMMWDTRASSTSSSDYNGQN